MKKKEKKRFIELHDSNIQRVALGNNDVKGFVSQTHINCETLFHINPFELSVSERTAGGPREVKIDGPESDRKIFPQLGGYRAEVISNEGQQDRAPVGRIRWRCNRSRSYLAFPGIACV